MPREKRVVLPGCPMHITHRGNNRSTIFLDDADCSAYYELLKEAHHKHSCAIHAYVFMNNHLHLLITPAAQESPGKMMHVVETVYARYFNRRYGRTGAVWEGRYHSSLVQSAKYFFTCSRYIELNPVRALMVDHPECHAWSSYHCNADAKSNALITPHAMYRNLARKARDCSSAYRALFANSLDTEAITAIRAGTKSNGLTGDSSFHHQIERQLQRKIATSARGGDRRSREYLSASVHSDAN